MATDESNDFGPLPRLKREGSMAVLVMDPKVFELLSKLGAPRGLRAEEVISEAVMEWFEKRGINPLTGEKK